MASLSILTGCTTTSDQPREPINFQATRLNNAQPIISSESFKAVGASAEEGANINGPSVIRIPSWIPKEQRASPTAEYYMYFAHHKGRYIRLAWAEQPEGPWHLYGSDAAVPAGSRGVLDIGNNRQLPLGESLTLIKHIASPDVHVDNDLQRIIMYFHAPVTSNGVKCPGQSTLVATSPWGLDFSQGIEPVILGRSYFRVFEVDGTLQSLVRKYHYTPKDSNSPWSPTADQTHCEPAWASASAAFLDFASTTLPKNDMPPAPGVRVRHLGLHRIRETLYIFFSMTGEAPERILVTNVQVGPGCWTCTQAPKQPMEVLRAQEVWEGSTVTPTASRKGAQTRLENALRDPFLFEDEGQLYLFYSGGGERAIGVARISLRPETL